MHLSIANQEAGAATMRFLYYLMLQYLVFNMFQFVCLRQFIIQSVSFI